MGLSIRWTEPAMDQFAELLDFIGGSNPDAARALRRKVDRSLLKLAEFPDMDRWVLEFGPGFYREIRVNSLRLLYENHGDALGVTYVHRHGEATGPNSFDEQS